MQRPHRSRILLRVVSTFAALAVVAVVVTVATPDHDVVQGQAAPAPTAPAPSDATLPSSEACARDVPRSGFEPRPDNSRANATTPPPGYRVPDWAGDGYAPEFNERIIPRIDGAYTGTTDEILQWGACKWGFAPDVVRAMAVEESNWNQWKEGDISRDDDDCVPGAESPCPTSFGILQVKHLFRPGSYPLSAQSTAFNVDYALAVIRGCYEGWVVYLAEEGDGYTRGDIWGCVGWHFSGHWYDAGATDYIARVREALDEASWQGW
jgi:autotransporter family porin